MELLSKDVLNIMVTMEMKRETTRHKNEDIMGNKDLEISMKKPPP